MTVVSNTGPLIALAKIDRLDLLLAIYGQVFIPKAVHQELLMKPDLADESERIGDAVSRGVLQVIDRLTSSVILRPRNRRLNTEREIWGRESEMPLDWSINCAVHSSFYLFPCC